MVYPHSVRHDRNALRFALTRFRMALNDRLDRGITPIEDALETCFVVGCGNSGTTLVASRLGTHPEAYVIPRETTLFRPRRRLSQARGRLMGWMETARATGARVLVEKTPKHIHSVARIRRLVPEARVVIVQRNPFDTCLSLKKRFGNLDFAIERWNLDNAPALDLPEDRLVTRVRYERLTESPEVEFPRLIGFLGLDWDATVLTSSRTAFGTFPHRMPTMKLRVEQVSQPIVPNSGKWRSELAPGEIDRVRRRTAGLFAALGGDPETGGWSG